MNRKYKMTGLILFIAISSTVLNAQDVRVNRAELPRKEYINKSHLSIIGFTVNESSFIDIQNILGYTSIIDDGHEDVICYCSNLKDDSTKLIFYKNDIADIVGFELCSGINNYKTCHETDKISIKTSTGGGLKLNLSKD